MVVRGVAQGSECCVLVVVNQQGASTGRVAEGGRGPVPAFSDTQRPCPGKPLCWHPTLLPSIVAVQPSPVPLLPHSTPPPFPQQCCCRAVDIRLPPSPLTQGHAVLQPRLGICERGQRPPRGLVHHKHLEQRSRGVGGCGLDWGAERLPRKLWFGIFAYWYICKNPPTPPVMWVPTWLRRRPRMSEPSAVMEGAASTSSGNVMGRRCRTRKCRGARVWLRRWWAGCRAVEEK